MTKLFIVIDPGLTGAFAVIDENNKLLAIEDLPTAYSGNGKSKVKRRIDATAMALLLKPYLKNSVACLEQVASRPGQGVASVFSLGDTYGSIRSTICVLGIPLTLIIPSVWKRDLGLAVGADKEYSRGLAVTLWPKAPLQFKKHHNRAEALLLAKWLRDVTMKTGVAA